MSKTIPSLEKAIKYLKENRDKVLSLEIELEKIKKNPEWVRSMNTLRDCAYKGIIDEAPLRSNNYRVPNKIV